MEDWYVVEDNVEICGTNQEVRLSPVQVTRARSNFFLRILQKIHNYNLS